MNIEQYADLQHMYVLQVASRPIGEYAPIMAQLICARSLVYCDYDDNVLFSASIFESMKHGGCNPYDHAHKLVSPLPGGLYFWIEDGKEQVVVYQSK